MQKEKKILLKVLVLGESGVGKTMILRKLIQKPFDTKFRPTIGADFFTVEGEANTVLQLWDTAGQERFQSLGAAFYRGSDAVILVYDVTNKNSFQKLPFWQSEFNTQVGKVVDNIIVIGNKTDLSDRQVTYEEGEKYAQSIGAMFLEMSAKETEEQVVKSKFFELADKIRLSE